MVTLGDILRRYGPAYRRQFGEQLSAEQHHALQAIAQCRTDALGGQVYQCAACATLRYSYHSCRNRHCPTCQHDATQAWLTQQQALLLPVPYFLVTFTLPAGLRPLARLAPRRIYTFLFRTSAAALQQLAQDPRFLGGQLGMIGVLQTWTRDLRYHPHVHYLVPAVGLAPDRQTWIVGGRTFLVHSKPLAQLFRAKFRAALRQLPGYREVSAATWTQRWVVDCRPVGSGQAALKYLAPYIFRVALSNNRLERVADDQVTFRYRECATGHLKRCTLPVHAFIRRFLQHILPKGFVKVRYYGLFRLGNRQLLGQARAALTPPAPAATTPLAAAGGIVAPATPAVVRCPRCGQPMHLVQTIPRRSRAPPACPHGATHSQRYQVCPAHLARGLPSVSWRSRRSAAYDGAQRLERSCSGSSTAAGPEVSRPRRVSNARRRRDGRTV
jgi:hypothetical protein